MAHALAAHEACRNFAVPLGFLVLESCGGGVTVLTQKLPELASESGADEQIALEVVS